MEFKHTQVGEVSLHTLENEFLKVVTLNYGASIYKLYTKVGNTWREVSVQPDDLDAFISSSFYYGKTIGRTSGRLFLPSYDIGDITYLLDGEGKPSVIHGGPNGFSFKHFEVIAYSQHDIIYKASSYEDEGPYDGILSLEVRFLVEGNQFKISFKAETTETTLCNITNHIYLNLSDAPTIDQHHLDIQADRYLNINEINKVLSIDPIQAPIIFDGKKPLQPLFDIMKHTPFDGFDHTFLLHKKGPYDLKASVDDLSLTVHTTYPSVVLYTHNNLAPYALRQLDTLDNKHIAFTIECQYEPGGIQVEGLHDAVLHPGEIYEHEMILTFESTKKV